MQPRVQKFMARTGTTALAAAAAATVGAAALALAGPASAESYVVDRYIEVSDCQPAVGQLCPQRPDVPFNSGSSGEYSVQFTANPSHCSDVIAHIFVDGRQWTNQRVGPGQSTTPVTVAVTTRDTHFVSVQAEGIEGGCNYGTLTNWGGTVHLRPLQDPNILGLPPSQDTYSGPNSGDLWNVINGRHVDRGCGPYGNSAALSSIALKYAKNMVQYDGRENPAGSFSPDTPASEAERAGFRPWGVLEYFKPDQDFGLGVVEVWSNDTGTRGVIPDCGLQQMEVAVWGAGTKRAAVVVLGTPA